ncbi:MAG TPA: ABC transporter permease [Chloroflexi bacterium]|nr:ABC transporter permease [Chloroflexota bacterium]
MKTILIIAQREITRLRSRFRGSSRPVVALALVGVSLVAYLTFRQGAMRGRGLYRVGLPPAADLAIQDSRFATIAIPLPTGRSLLEAGALDAYVDTAAARIIHRQDDRSLYAANALKLYLEKQELARLEQEYHPDAAFPLRVQVNHFPVDPQAEAEEILIPSLMTPPLPFAQVVTISLYLLPVFFVSVFFTSGLMDEKIDRRITVLMSAPVTPFQIIAGKMLPYIGFALLSVVGLTLILQGSVLLALAIFLPVILFIFSIYLMVPLVYRTFKDTTFISMLATTIITSYLVFPAMFSGLNDLSHISPLTLAVKMYRDEPFTLKEYLTSTASMYLVFAFATYIGTRILNEEYLTRFRPLYRKVSDAIYLALDRSRPHLSILLLSACLIPIVYMIQLVTLAVSLNLPIRLAIGALLIASVLIEEVAKSVGIVTLIENGDATRGREILPLSFLSALGFLVGEKLLLYVSVSIVSETMLSAALFNVGMLWIPLLAHIIFTTMVCLLTHWWGIRRYLYALLIGSAVHVVYNLFVLGVIG